jgi:hypothetical protein
VFLEHVLSSCQFQAINFLLIHQLSIALGRKVVDITCPDPHNSVSALEHAFAKFKLVGVVREALIEPSQLLPEAEANEERETRSPG